MARFSVSPKAKRDVGEIFLYISRDSVEAAARVRARLEQSFITIAGQPKIGRLREDLPPTDRMLTVDNYVVY